MPDDRPNQRAWAEVADEAEAWSRCDCGCYVPPHSERRPWTFKRVLAWCAVSSFIIGFLAAWVTYAIATIRHVFGA